MKIAKIIKQTEEYHKLQAMINNIEDALEIMNKKQDSTNSFTTITYNDTGNGCISSGCITPVSLPTVSLSTAVFDYIKADFKKLLEQRLAVLKDKQDSLEV